MPCHFIVDNCVATELCIYDTLVRLTSGTGEEKRTATARDASRLPSLQRHQRNVVIKTTKRKEEDESDEGADGEEDEEDNNIEDETLEELGKQQDTATEPQLFT